MKRYIMETLGWSEDKPVDVTTWFKINEPKIYPRNSVEYVRDKIHFVRDILCKLLWSFDERSSNPPMVINSVNTLPIFDINLKKYDVDVLLYSYGDEWDISVKSGKPLDFDFMGVFNPTESASIFVFHADRTYDSYEPSVREFSSVYSSTKESTSLNMNSAKFTAHFRSDYDLYTFFFLLKHYLDGKHGK